MGQAVSIDISTMYIDCELWDEIAPLLKEATDLSNGEDTLDCIKERIEDSETYLMVIRIDDKITAVATMEVHEYDSGLRALFMPMVAGTKMDIWADRLLEELERNAFKLRCSEVRGFAARPGWQKYLGKRGWKTLHTIVGKKLGE
ncbi:MAG: hypothetical protein DRP85_03275 [Candidatus Makaraimicrobium thalassicum]|nr:MAG: hypothetical protein DRP85_03275 [Candidatus Omnitrophota bacterium]